LDATCREHDIAYSRSNDLTEKHVADRILGVEACERITAKDSLGEKVAATAVWTAMKAKTKISMGMKTKRKTKMKTMKKTMKKRILPTTKCDGILSVNDNKAAQCQLLSQSRNGKSRILSCSLI